MVGVPVGAVAIIAAALVVGALVQGVVGLGLGLVAAPVTVLAAPELMPGLLIALAMVLPLMTLVGQHQDIDWHGLTWSLPLRVVGTVVGVLVVAYFSERALGISIGLMVLAAVVLTWRAVDIPVTRRTLAAAGFVSGITGTATSIGGPPFALLYQHRSGEQIRSTMAVYFIVGAGLSLTGLAVSGSLTGQELALALLLLPAVLLGVVLSVPVRRHLAPHLVRPAVLSVCAASAVVLLAKSLLG